MPQLASLGSMLQPILGVVSTVSGLINSYQQQQYQNKLRGLAEDPKKMQNYIAGFKQPLAAGLEKGVANSAQGYAAERGLATSPALEQSIYSQAIAPYIQQQQQTATQDAFSALGLGGGANPGNPTASIASGLGLLNPQSGGGGSTPTFSDPTAGNQPSIFPADWNAPPPAPISLPDYPVDLTAFGYGAP